MNYYAIIVAGGTGRRMNTALPKQFIPLLDKPVLMHTIESFSRSSFNPKILLMLHPDYVDYWTELCEEYRFKIPHQILSGGAERFNSVKNALAETSDNAVIAVHDAVRPLVSTELINRIFSETQYHQAVIPAVESRDSIRLREAGSTRVIPRANILLVQTPQAFNGALLKQAYEQPYDSVFTDDASVVEALGQHVHVIDGESSNIKITYNEDLEIAALLLKRRTER